MYLKLEKWQSAIDALKLVTIKDKNNTDAQNALGQAWEGLKDWDKAIASYDQALLVDQQFASAHVNRALVLLRKGQLKEGWEGFEWRWKIPRITPLNCPQSQWQGEDISDKIILVHTEQSDSDIILFARFIPQLAKRAGKVIVLCDESFRLFFKSISGVDEVRVQSVGISNECFDVYIPIMSLPHALDTGVESLATVLPYWKILPEVIVALLKSEKRYKVGLVWRNDSIVDSISAEENNLSGLLSLVVEDDIQLYSLQNTLKSGEPALLEKNKIINLQAEMVSHAHTGALVSQLDLLITVGNSLAHLSGSLGVKTLLLPEKNPKWYWMEEGERSLWYPDIDRVADKDGLLSGMRTLLTQY